MMCIIIIIRSVPTGTGCITVAVLNTRNIRAVAVVIIIVRINDRIRGDNRFLRRSYRGNFFHRIDILGIIVVCLRRSHGSRVLFRSVVYIVVRLRGSHGSRVRSRSVVGTVACLRGSHRSRVNSRSVICIVVFLRGNGGGDGAGCRTASIVITAQIIGTIGSQRTVSLITDSVLAAMCPETVSSVLTYAVNVAASV
jgi:hypothetical protein